MESWSVESRCTYLIFEGILVLQTPKDHSDWHKLEQAVSSEQSIWCSFQRLFQNMQICVMVKGKEL